VILSNPYANLVVYDDVIYNMPLSFYRVYDPALNKQYSLEEYLEKENLSKPIPSFF
jgi:hypothetical protein